MTAAHAGGDLARLGQKLGFFIRRSAEGQTSESEFDQLALEVFAFQYAHIEPYRSLCRREGRTPDSVTSWSGIPAVPAQAFKQFTLFAAEPAAVAKTFRSSGTSEPGRSSQAHFTASGLDLMDTAVAVNAQERLFPDGRRTRILALTPPPDAVPHMIMVHGMAHLLKTFGLEGSRFLAGPSGLDRAALWDELVACQRADIPVSLVGASFGFVHFFDWMEEGGRRLALPPGSRLMDAGGYKGRSREIGRAEFVSWAAALCGIPPERIVNLLGMTEMASQIYDSIAAGASAPRRKLAPAWVRTDVVDPRQTGPGGPRPVGAGEVGLLRHLDLANLERPLRVQSEDLARCVAGASQGGAPTPLGFEILGRARGAEPRGCSLTADDLRPEPAGRSGRSS